MALVSLEIACKQVLGITSRRYRQLVQEHGAPAVEKGQINILKACKWLLEYQRALLAGQGSLSLTNERMRLTRIQADRRELQLQRERGELIHVDTAMKLWGNIAMQIRQKLLAIPTKASPLVYGSRTIAESKQVLEKFVDEVLNEISETEPRLEEHQNSSRKYSDNTKTASTTTNKRMGGKGKKVESRSVSRARAVV